MKSFLIALQFLTRLHLVRQSVWTAEDFGRSTRWFPLVGVVLGLLYAACAWLMYTFFGQGAFTAVLLTIVPLVLTGGIHADGFMDTMDGVFSGRERERKLEIMKDSRVGSFGAVSFVCLFATDASLVYDMGQTFALPALFVMPIIGRLAMTTVISFFPYVRKEGMGKAFADMSDGGTFLFALCLAALFVLPNGIVAGASLIAGLVFCFLFASYVKGQLGGLTGDVYGATEILTETVVLFVFFIASRLMDGFAIPWIFLFSTMG